MTRKPGSMYREIRGQAYARKEYMGGVPGIRISQFDIGDPRTKFPMKIHLVAAEACQIRHIALEAARISANGAAGTACIHQVAPVSAMAAMSARSRGPRIAMSNGPGVARRCSIAAFSARTSSGVKSSQAPVSGSLYGTMPSHRAARRTTPRLCALPPIQMGILGDCTGLGRSVAAST